MAVLDDIPVVLAPLCKVEFDYPPMHSDLAPFIRKVTTRNGTDITDEVMANRQIWENVVRQLMGETV